MTASNLCEQRATGKNDVCAESLKMEVVGESVGLDKDGEDKKKKSYAGIPEAAFVVSKYILLLWNIMYAI